MYTYVIAGMAASFILAVSMLFFYLRYKKNLLQQQYLLKEAEVQHQTALLHTIISSQEKERRRIGMDLHDEVGSTLASLRLTIENFTENHAHVTTITQFNVQCRAIIDKVITNTRDISHNLSPMLKGAHGFYDMVHDYCDNLNSSGKIQIDVIFQDNNVFAGFSNNVTLAIYRVITELINNTLKHASAKNILIVFAVIDNLFMINYKDDGIGITTEAKNKGMGLQNIESRLGMIGATYEINYGNDKGFQTSITLIV